MATIHFQTRDIPDGGMRGYAADDQKILILRDGERIRAFQGTCPHAGADLSEGVRCAGRVVCPWHHAAFDTTDGGLREPPATEHLTRFVVERDGDGWCVDTSRTAPTSAPIPQLANDHVVIVGAGASAFMTAQTLRLRGYAGHITMLAPEGVAPYDRTMLSKAFLAGEMDADDLPLGGQDWADRQRITLVKTPVSALDMAHKHVTLAGGERLRYDHLVVATGASPESADLPGADLSGVHMLRSLDDAKSLREGAQGQDIVIVGTGFIGLEAAASLVGDGGAKSVTVIGPDDQILRGLLGPEPARAIQDLHAHNGVRFRLGQRVEALHGDGQVDAVILEDGTRVKCGLALLGLGVTPDAGLLGEFVDEDGAVKVDAGMRVAPSVYAVGDIAAAPTACGRLRVEHWRVAMQEGMAAAEAILARQQGAMDGRVPFFWTMQYGKSLRYVGHARPGAERHLWGDPGSLDFIEFSLEGGYAVAAAGVGQGKALAAFEELLRGGRSPSADEIKAGPFDLVQALQESDGQRRAA
ncbi:FAD-dependent oxidoreductase [Pseudoxanthomonas sp. JBR18]|uniref:FAD-dependent oxidoreductase n=1 Tax=Pseudoxanthomonas sp. JBR18 TaxID=2969308 RepID=UPI002304D2E5|nr:FAD-dependent oxidoreductase [Pseudoxanthomonas sp. JBR18]WCE03923.1 FAD-dependent oxidoreductase [Pseudoxanthomonas sp. JBR18]